MFPNSEFKIAYLTFQMEAEGRIELPEFQGAFFRGSFGKIFRKIVCLQRQEICDECRLIKNCVYVYLFESRRLANNNLTWNTSHDPHPFVLEPPLSNKLIYYPGDGFSIGLVLFGEGIAYLPYFILVFEEMGRRGIGKQYGRFKLTEVTATDIKGEVQVYNSLDGNLKDNIPVITPEILNLLNLTGSNKVDLNLLTPARIQQHGEPVRQLTFPLLVRALMRRYSWLSSLYSGSLPELAYQDILLQAESEVKLISSSLKWQKLEHYSYRQNKHYKMGGLTGELNFIGNLSPFLPLLRLGEYLHVGKGTAFGLGRYRVIIN